MGNQPCLRLTLESKTKNVREVEPFVCRCREKVSFSDQLYYDILLVLTEAVTNGIQHGNQEDPRKKVTVCFFMEAGKLQFVVKDEGKGFDPRKLADPTRGPQLTQPNGRGVYLMQELAHCCEFQDNGRAVRLRFDIS